MEEVVALWRAFQLERVGMVVQSPAEVTLAAC